MGMDFVRRGEDERLRGRFLYSRKFPLQREGAIAAALADEQSAVVLHESGGDPDGWQRL
jgi:hypothetical protein